MTTVLKFGRSITIALAALTFVGIVGGIAGCASAGEEDIDPVTVPNPPPPPPTPDASQPDAPTVPDAPVIPDAPSGTLQEGEACTSNGECAPSLCCFGPDFGLPGMCSPGEVIPGLGCFPF